MTREEQLNVLSAHQLSEHTLDFLNSIKFKKYDKESRDKFKRMAYINNSPEMMKKIMDAKYEMGFCETYVLHSIPFSSQKARCLAELNQERKSVRRFGNDPINLNQVSAFFNLFYTLTGQEEFDFKGVSLTQMKRNIASGGSLYPTEIYFVNHRITELPLGVYHYNVFTFSLELIRALPTAAEWDFFFEIIMKADSSSIDFDQASAFVIFSSVFNKQSFKYQDFGVALSLVEVGEFIHAAYLALAALELRGCAFGGFLSKEMHQFLALKNSLHQPLFCIAIGDQLK